MSNEGKAENKKCPEVKPSKKEEEKQSTPSERDHYVYESIIAEIGY